MPLRDSEGPSSVRDRRSLFPGRNRELRQHSPAAYDQQMTNQEESREEWEQGLREVQQNITPAQGLRAAHHVAKRNSSAPIPDFAHLARLVLGGALLALEITAFSSRIPHSTAVGASTLIAGCYVGFTAFRWKRK
jgi:hypothetical protein